MNQEEKIKLMVLVGPTGIGKTELGISIAGEFNTEIISCDSMQIYRYMDIGTAKPTPAQQKIVSHHLIDIINPDENYDAAQYHIDAGNIIRDMIKKNKIPLIIGGTGFYLRALLDGLFEMPKIPVEFRMEIVEKYKNYSNTGLHEILNKIDPVAGGKIHPNDRKRILRALEVYFHTGFPISELQNKSKNIDSSYQPVIIGLYLPMKELYQHINQRVMEMFDAGWMDEVGKLRRMGYSSRLSSMQSLGYKYINAHLDGILPEKDIIPLTQRDTRRYAKRQMTWFRAMTGIHWFNRKEPSISDIIHLYRSKLVE